MSFLGTHGSQPLCLITFLPCQFLGLAVSEALLTPRSGQYRSVQRTRQRLGRGPIGCCVQREGSEIPCCHTREQKFVVNYVPADYAHHFTSQRMGFDHLVLLCPGSQKLS